MKTDGLDQSRSAQPCAPPTMTLGGLLKHLALVEASWFSDVLLGEPLIPPFDAVDWDADRDWEWHSAAEDTPEELRRPVRRGRRRAPTRSSATRWPTVAWSGVGPRSKPHGEARSACAGSSCT